MQKIAIFTALVSGSIVIISLSAPAQASSFEVAGIYSASLSGDAEIPSVNTPASGKATSLSASDQSEDVEKVHRHKYLSDNPEDICKRNY